MRAENAKKFREMQKKKQEMEKLHLQINALEKNINSLENAKKSIHAQLSVLSLEASKKYPKFASEDSDYILTQLGEYYDTFKMEQYDTQIRELRETYDILMNPLRERLKELESEFNEKRSIIDAEKAKKNIEVMWVESHQDALLAEYDKIEIYDSKIEANSKKLKELREKYDTEFKELWI